MKVEKLVHEWPTRWPRPTIGSTKNAVSQLKHFQAFFAGREVEEITRDEFRRFALAHPGAARYARTMLYDALDAGIVEEVVAAGVKVPKPRRRRVEPPTPYSVLHLSQVAHSTGVHWLGQMILLAAHTGLREGELRALALADLHFRDPAIDVPTRIRVEYSINRREELVPAKTETSENVCAVLPKARPAFHRLVPGRGVETPIRPGRLFPVTRNRRQAAWDDLRRGTGIECRWHDLRHFCATELLDAGATVDDVALQLRCSVDEVRRTYGHPDREAALGRLEAIAG